jgi:histidinol phosphatase-like enzyme (inositol monophosphatase family)
VPGAEFDLDHLGGASTLRELVDEVLACGEDALRLYRAGAGDRAVAKLDRSPVTEADRAVEERLRAFVARRFPDAAFLGEETGDTGPSRSNTRFVVDPIDGTRAFMRGIPTWTILVGIEFENEPVVGIAYMPAAPDLFVAYRGHGAWGNGRPLHVTRVESVDAALVCFGDLHQFLDTDAMPMLERLGKGTFSQRGFHDFDGYRKLLFGQADAMVDPGIKPWDVCAAAVLVEEAGGVLTSFSGKRTVWEGSALASNGVLHEALLAIVAETV